MCRAERVRRTASLFFLVFLHWPVADLAAPCWLPFCLLSPLAITLFVSYTRRPRRPSNTRGRIDPHEFIAEAAHSLARHALCCVHSSLVLHPECCIQSWLAGASSSPAQPHVHLYLWAVCAHKPPGGGCLQHSLAQRSPCRSMPCHPLTFVILAACLLLTWRLCPAVRYMMRAAEAGAHPPLDQLTAATPAPQLLCCRPASACTSCSPRPVAGPSSSARDW